MKPFSIRPGADDDNTLLYAAADHGWLQGESVIGPDFTNFGADPTDRGYRFVRADGDYMDAAFAGQPQRSQLTLECWVPGWWQEPVANWSYREIADFYINADNYIRVTTLRRDSVTQSRIMVYLHVGGVEVGRLLWQGVIVDALLASENRWHVAAVLDSPNSLRLFVNGEMKVEDLVGIADLPEGNYTLRLGRYLSGNAIYDLDAVLDEVRLSKVARYAANFPIARFQEGERAGLRGPGETVEVAGGIV